MELRKFKRLRINKELWLARILHNLIERGILFHIEEKRKISC